MAVLYAFSDISRVSAIMQLLWHWFDFKDSIVAKIRHCMKRYPLPISVSLVVFWCSLCKTDLTGANPPVLYNILAETAHSNASYFQAIFKYSFRLGYVSSAFIQCRINQ